MFSSFEVETYPTSKVKRRGPWKIAAAPLFLCVVLIERERDKVIVELPLWSGTPCNPETGSGLTPVDSEVGFVIIVLLLSVQLGIRKYKVNGADACTLYVRTSSNG